MNIVKLFYQIKSVYDKLNLQKKVLLALIILLTISAFIYIINWTENQNYQILYSNIKQEEAGLIISFLKDNKYKYKISEDGNQILMPKENIYEARMSLASKGLPKGADIGFEIFDKNKIGMSEFDQNINYQRALQGEISRTINEFEEVENSRVHLVMESKSIFKEDEKPASASIVLNLKYGRNLTKNQIQSIIHLVSASVPGLLLENVIIVDNKGNMLSGSKNNYGYGNLSDTYLEYQYSVEKNMENKIKIMLESVLGSSKAVVKIACLMDFKKQEKTEELYYPENKVIRSEKHFNEFTGKNNNGEKKISKIEDKNNSVNNKIDKNENKNYEKYDKTVNYEIGKVINHIIEPVGIIKRITAAVIIDGSYKENKKGDGKKGIEYIPRSKEELNKLENIIKNSINYDESRNDKVELINMQFQLSNEENKENKKNNSSFIKKVLNIIKDPNIVAIITIILVFIFIIKPLVMYITSNNNSNINEIEYSDKLPQKVSDLERSIQNNKNIISYKQQIDQIIKNEKSSVELLKQWLNEA